MATIKEMADYLIILVRAGAGLRAVYCFIRMGMNEEETSMYKKRLRNVVIFYILAELSWQLKDMVMGYYT